LMDLVLLGGLYWGIQLVFSCIEADFSFAFPTRSGWAMRR
jgi:hypothetical protein